MAIFSKKPTAVDAIMGTFHRTIAQLDKAAKDHSALADHHAEQAHTHLSAASAADSEAERAEKLAAHLRGVFGVTADAA